MGYYKRVYVETASDRFWSFAFKSIVVLFIAGLVLKVLIPIAIVLLVLRLIFA